MVLNGNLRTVCADSSFLEAEIVLLGRPWVGYVSILSLYLRHINQAGSELLILLMEGQTKSCLVHLLSQIMYLCS